MPYPSVNQGCAVRERPTSLWCSRCQNTWYCSPEHMRSDWPRHRSNCQAPSSLYGLNMIATPSPAEPEYISVNAILCLAGEERPRIISVRCRPSQRPSHGRCPVLALQPYFDAPPDNVVLTQGLNGEPLRFPLHIFYSSSALGKSSPVNRAIYHITSGAVPKAWCGNIVAFKFNGARCQGFTDTVSSDLPALSTYFLSCQ
ncbi:hypothetical protein DFH08DRAFT_880893 [Mycena albidolilacea]|uniref:MYND-type domain-containing protein n=1 Tax=Mycena albidolilacea TaxID=1033008 RepID=A0AAD6ZPF3_9AGAR|nr:hypothetical protein DFH08DRAFT_880893 [Mycena albidolilacea]